MKQSIALLLAFLEHPRMWLALALPAVASLATAQTYGFSATVQNDLQVLATVRAEIDAKGLPPAPSASPLVFTHAGDFLTLHWHGGTLESSADLQTWTPITWADSPFAELLKPPRFTNQFYRVLPPP